MEVEDEESVGYIHVHKGYVVQGENDRVKGYTLSLSQLVNVF